MPWITEGGRTDGSHYGACATGIEVAPWSMNNDPDSLRVHRFDDRDEAQAV